MRGVLYLGLGFLSLFGFRHLWSRDTKLVS